MFIFNFLWFAFKNTSTVWAHEKFLDLKIFIFSTRNCGLILNLRFKKYTLRNSCTQEFALGKVWTYVFLHTFNLEEEKQLHSQEVFTFTLYFFLPLLFLAINITFAQLVDFVKLCHCVKMKRALTNPLRNYYSFLRKLILS